MTSALSSFVHALSGADTKPRHQIWPGEEYPFVDSSQGWLTVRTKPLQLPVTVQFVAITRFEMGFPETEPEFNLIVKALPEN